MDCPNCGKRMKAANVSVEGADTKVKSYQCASCDYIEFDEGTSKEVVAELKAKESPLQMEQTIVKLSHDRLGLYLNKHIVKSLHLKAGEQVQVSVPSKNRIVIRLQGKG